MFLTALAGAQCVELHIDRAIGTQMEIVHVVVHSSLD
jgi:hypothetical protein